MADVFDVAVVGAGIAGASAAYELAGIGSVVLLEMERTPGHHSTGRSAALYTECYGNPVIRRLARASKPFLDGPPQGFADGPLLSSRGVLFVGPSDRAAALDAAAAEFSEMVPDIRRLTAGECRSLVPVLTEEMADGAIHEPHAMDIDVHGLHMGFVAGARNRGADFRLDSKVVALRRETDAWHITTTSEAVRAGVVVNAAGAWCDVLADMAGVPRIGLVPKRRTAFTFSPPADADHADWPLVVDVDETFYFKPEGPHLFGSPADQTPTEPQDVRHEEIDVALAIERITTATDMSIRSVHSAWAGLRSFVHDKVPVVGMDPDHDGFFWLAGQGGYGIKTSPALARATRSLISDGQMPQDIEELGVTAATLGVGRLRGR